MRAAHFGSKGLLTLLCVVALAVAAFVLVDSVRARPRSSDDLPQAQAGTPKKTQAKNQPASPQSTRPLRTTTRMVQVSVVVHDKHGDPVTGLTKDDFILLDDKREQTIQLFSEETTRAAENAPATPPPPNSYTNRMPDRSGVPTSVTVVLIDGANTQPGDIAYVRKYIIKFLGQIQPNDRVALYWLGTKLRIVHDFTSDAAGLVAAISKYQGPTASLIDSSTPEKQPGWEAATAEVGTNPYVKNLLIEMKEQGKRGMEDRVRLTSDAMTAIANHVADIPGRKNLIWVSGSFPFSIGFQSLDLTDKLNDWFMYENFDDTVKKFAQVLNDSNIAVYPVDARGLMAEGLTVSASAMPVSGSNINGGGPDVLKGPDKQNFDTMDILADRTGGRAFYNTNDVYRSIRRAIDDSRVAYTLSFYPDNGSWDGKFHTIKVEVKKPGMEVRSRSGYFAVTEPKPKAESLAAAVGRAATSPLEATAIGMRADVRAGDVPGARALTLKLHFDLREIQMTLENGHWMGALDLALVELTPDDKILDGTNDSIQFNFTQDRYEQLLKDGASYSTGVQVVPKGRGHMRGCARSHERQHGLGDDSDREVLPSCGCQKPLKAKHRGHGEKHEFTETRRCECAREWNRGCAGYGRATDSGTIAASIASISRWPFSFTGRSGGRGRPPK
jgi:VWFA-related protein